VTPNPVSAASFSDPGDFAADYLRGTHFTALEVEVDFPSSRPPTPAVLALLEERLLERCDKVDVAVVLDDAIPDARFPAVVSIGDLHDIEEEYRDDWSDSASDTAVMYLLYSLGQADAATGGSAVLGVAHRGASVALFVEQVDDAGDIFFTDEDFEGHSVVHEAGHLLGLVNGGTPMVQDHEDEDHPYHSEDEDCVMYWAVGGGALSPHLGDPDFARFGPFSTADMIAFGGRP
jgi:hypothetical protein